MTDAVVQEEVEINSQQRMDRRVRRTRELLRAALLSLIEEKGYAAITVQDILDRADVGRSTFYAHFTDKEDLLRNGFDEFRSTTLAEMHSAGASAGGKVEFLEPMLSVFRHVEEHRARWKPLAGKGGAELVIRLLQERVVDLVREHLRSQLPEMRGRRRETELEAAVQFLVGSSMGLINWWLENEVECSAEELHSIFRGLSVQGVRRFLVSS
jgi:AcrR family transcriptional regulator